MNLNTSSGAGAGAMNLKIASSGAAAWSILDQLPSPGCMQSFCQNGLSRLVNCLIPTTCPPHKDGNILLSALPEDLTSVLDGFVLNVQQCVINEIAKIFSKILAIYL